MTRPAIYIRVSTPGQAAEGLSLEEQERRLRAYAAALGWPEPTPYIDAGGDYGLAATIAGMSL